MTRKNLAIIISIIAVGIISGISLFMSCVSPTEPEVEVEVIALKLSDYPEIFSKDAVIVVGHKASGIEKESAQAIAENLRSSTGIKPRVVTDTEITDVNLSNHNLILVGTSDSNKLLNIVYDMTDATRITKEYPGENKGILEILRNPWNKKRTLLLVAGNDEWGVKAGSELLEYARDLDIGRAASEWREAKPIFSRTISRDKYLFLEIEKRIKVGPSSPRLMIDRYPLTYYFDETSGNLKIWGMGGLSVKDKFITNDGLVVLIGSIVGIEKGIGSGRGIVPLVYTIPFSFQREDLNFLEVVYLKNDGTVYLRYEDEKIVIGFKEEHKTSFRKNDAVHTVTIKNRGLLDKSKIIVE